MKTEPGLGLEQSEKVGDSVVCLGCLSVVGMRVKTGFEPTQIMVKVEKRVALSA